MNSSVTYQLPADQQTLEADARNIALKEVEDMSPEVYRVQGELENHARARCEQSLASTPHLTNDPEAYRVSYVGAYVQAYETGMQKLDVQKWRSHKPE